MPDFIPRRDDELLNWARNFSEKLNESPEAYGIPPERAAELVLLQTAYAELYQLANQQGSSTAVVIRAKDNARKVMVDAARRLAKIVRGTSSVTSAQRIDLGLKPQKTTRSKIARPDTAPWVNIIQMSGSLATIRLSDPESPSRLAKPKNVGAAMIWTHIGDQPPTDPCAWKHHSMTTRTVKKIKLGRNLPPGTQVWIAAQWTSPTVKSGPISSPVCTHIQFGEVDPPNKLARAA